MRQTSIGSFPLPDRGRVSSYVAHVPATEGRELPVSFDQGIHVGVGPRPGSWMGVGFTPQVFTPGVPVDRDLLAAAWHAVIARHGTLRTAFSTGADGAVRLHEIEVLPGSWVDHIPAQGQRPADVVQSVLDSACSPYERPSHRLLLVEGEGRPTVVIGADHAHVDAWSMLVLVRDLTTILDDLLADRTPGADLPPVPAFAEHTALLAAQPPAPAEVTARWAEILRRAGGVMPVFPLSLGDVSRPRPDVVDVVDILDAGELAAYGDRAAELGARMLPLTVSVMTRVTLELTGAPLRAVMPVHSRHEPRWRDAVGWFITNSVLDADLPDVPHCAAAVKEAVILGSYPLAPIMAPYGGMPTAPGMFALSWLDNRRLPVTLPPGLSPYQLSASLPTQGVMVWFLLNDDGMHVRCRYPDTPEAHASVGAWLTAVSDGIRAEVGRPPLRFAVA
ncbi:condensation domain-containing protein [Raineyella sp. W15-4]|uniref:condensation domain-containing protein n=1 Tax=Raineyella sp. W15-4 TaxID=3081651 RepID=UPI0029529789|nr:condensation domain-containing protein [Raineyella sp. W15-4]WOQ16504.1 condensation domain-containing protein [Raineyella sp. W15-4]